MKLSISILTVFIAQVLSFAQFQITNADFELWIIADNGMDSLSNWSSTNAVVPPAYTSLTTCQPPNEESALRSKTVGGGCDGCELMYLGMPEQITPVDTSAGWYEEGEKLLIKGKVFLKDGKTHATGVIIYYWQTDNNGYYSTGNEIAEDTRHGHIRGWVKTGSSGDYSIFTIRPAPYPNRSLEAHIHVSIKEPNKNEYYIDEYVFDDDPSLTEDRRKKLENRGGSGILKPVLIGGVLTVKRDIVLGLNIPDYE